MVKIMKNILKVTAILLAAGLFTSSANAVPVATNTWSVSDAASNCTGGDHGLWTNSLHASNSSCSNKFSFQAGSTLTEYDNGTAVLNATAKNPDSILATIDITFGSYSTTQSPVKTGGGSELPSWYFYQSIDSGSIDIGGTDYDVLGMTGGYALQIGDGANDKSSVFGGSVWLDLSGGYTGRGGHWDLNMNLAAASVPEPSALMLIAIGLIGFGARSYRKKI
jgi:hypothetical protein